MYDYVKQGWQCPVCKRIYGPDVAQCLYCNDARVIWATNTNTDDWIKPEFIRQYEEESREWLRPSTTQTIII